MSVSTGEINWTALDRVIYGKPAAEAVAEEAERRGAKRVFLLVSTYLDTKTDEIEAMRKALGSRYAASYSGIRPHGPQVDVIAAAAVARDAGADLVVTVGGGSVTDAGKILPICLKHNVTSPEELDAFRAQYDNTGKVAPAAYALPDVRTICVPTTLSGGEFNPLAGASDGKRKHGYQNDLSVPVAVIFDPALTRHTPDWLWFSTGVRAVDHAVETLVSTYSNDFFDGLADSALRLLVEGLTLVKANPGDLDGRLKCQFGAWQSMVPMIGGVPMGGSHAIGHILGAVCDVPHGYTSCVMAPYVQAWNAEVAAAGQKRISRCMGRPDIPAAELLDTFIRSLGMPRTLNEVGVREEHLQTIAENTLHDIWGRTNPRPLETSADVMAILRTAMAA